MAICRRAKLALLCFASFKIKSITWTNVRFKKILGGADSRSSRTFRTSCSCWKLELLHLGTSTPGPDVTAQRKLFKIVIRAQQLSLQLLKSDQGLACHLDRVLQMTSLYPGPLRSCSFSGFPKWIELFALCVLL